MLTIAFPAEEGAAGLRPVGTGANDGFVVVDAELIGIVEDGGHVGTVAAEVEGGGFFCHRLEW
jgi:hypothetical protein